MQAEFGQTAAYCAGKRPPEFYATPEPRIHPQVQSAQSLRTGFRTGETLGHLGHSDWTVLNGRLDFPDPCAEICLRPAPGSPSRNGIAMFPDLNSLPLRPAEIRQALLRYRIPAILLFLAILGTAFGGTLLLTKTYYSEAKLLVKNGRENSTLDPTATTGQVIPVSDSREGEINSLVEVFRNRVLLDRVVERIGAENILVGDSPLQRLLKSAVAKFSPPTNDQPADAAEPTIAEHPSQRHSLAIQALERSVNVNSPRRSNVISVFAKAKTPELAQQIVAELTTEYLREHQRIHSSTQSFEFFTHEAKQQADRLAAARGALRETKDKYKIVTFEGKRAALQGRLSDLEQRQGFAATELAQSETRVTALQKLVEEFPDQEVTSETNVANEGAYTMANTLFQFRLQAIEQLAKYSEEHPLALAARQRLQDGAAALANVDPLLTQMTKSAHPLKQKLRADLAQEKALVETTRSRIQSLETLLAQAAEDLQTLNGQEVELATLQQDVGLAEVALRVANEKLEQARVNFDLDHEKFSNLRLVQPASYNIKASGVSRAAVGLLGLMLACTGSLGLPLGLAWLNPQLRTRLDLERTLGVPVLAAVKGLRTTSFAGSQHAVSL